MVCFVFVVFSDGLGSFLYFVRSEYVGWERLRIGFGDFASRFVFFGRL